MPYKDPERKRAYNREYRRRRANVKSSPLPGEQKGTGSLYQVRPWTRFFARYCDYVIYCSVVSNAMFYIAPAFTKDFINQYSVYLFMSLLLLSWAFFEAVLLCAYGTTPGKKLLSISIKNLLGDNLTYRMALRRSMKIFWLGMGFGTLAIPANVYSYYILKRDGVTTWDREQDIIVRHNELNPPLVVTVAIIFIVKLLFSYYL